MSRRVPIEFFNKANSSIKSNDYNDARYYFDKILAIDSYNEEAIVGKAFCLYHLGDKEFAYKLCNMVSKNNLKEDTLNYYNHVLKNEENQSNSDNPSLNDLFKKAHDSIILEEFDSAKFYFNQILDIDSGNIDAKIGKAYCFYCFGNISFSRTLCSYEDFNELSPICMDYYNKIMGNNLDAPVKQFKSRQIEKLFKRAGYSINRAEYNQAISYLNRILNIENDADAIVCKAYCYYKLEKFYSAYKLLEEINKSMLNQDYFSYYDELIYNNNDKSFLNFNDNYSAQEDSDVALLIQKGFKRLSQIDYNIAKRYFDKALKLNPNDSNALVGQSFCYYKFGNYSRAKELYSKINKEKLSELSYKYYSILFDRYGEIYVENVVSEGKKRCPECGRIVNDYAMRCVSCNHYFEDNYLSDNEKSFLNNVSCEEGFKLIDKKEYARALLRFNKLLEYNSEDVLSILGKAICYQNLEKHEEALELCNHALDIFSDIEDYDIFNDLVSDINESISIKSKNKKCPSCGKTILKDSIWCIYCNHYFKENDHEYYLKQDKLDMYLLLNSRNRYSSLDDYVDVLHWGYVYSLRRNLDDAMICINQILEFYPHNPKYLYDKAIVFYKKEKYDETLMLIEQVRNIDKSIVNEEWYEDLCKIGKEDLFKNLIKNARNASLEENFESALSYYNQALIFEPHNIYVLNNKAHTLLNLENYEESIKIFDEVLEIDFEYIDALLGKSYALYNSKKYKEALTCFNKIIEIFDGFIDYEFYNDLFEKAENE